MPPTSLLRRTVLCLLFSVLALTPALAREPGPPADRVWADVLAGLPAADKARLGRVTGTLKPGHWKGLSPAHKKQLLSYIDNRFDSESPMAICWNEATPLMVVEAFRAVEQAAEKGRPLRVGAANQIGSHWGTTVTNGGGQNEQGKPVTLTWSIVPDGTPIPSAFAGDSSDPSNFLAWIVGIYGGNASLPPDDPANAAWFSLIEDMFASYAAKTGLRYVYEPNDDGASFPSNSGIAGVRGDVRIGGHRIDGNSNTLAYNYFPNSGDMVLDTADNWYNGTGLSNDSRGMRNVLEHEHGHGIGLDHVCPINQTKLMEPFISTAYLGLQFDDIYSSTRNYGDFYEQHGVLRDNDSFTNAADLGLASGVQFGFQWVCIDDSTDVDYYSFAGPVGAQVTARIIPSTASYLEGPQNGDGSCTAGTTFDSSIQHDLVLNLYGPTQNLLTSVDLNGPGNQEEIVNFSLTSAGTHYLRVSGGASDSAQLYRLEVLVEAPTVALAVQSYGISLESLVPANGVVDPRETVLVGVDIGNSGTQAATNVQGTLTGPAGFTGFSTVYNFGSLGAGGSDQGSFVFGLDGAFGETISLDLQLTADGGVSEVTPLTFTLGKQITAFFLQEDFDASASLPGTWSATTTGSAPAWSVVGTDFNSPPSSAFVASNTSAGTAVLTSPSVTVIGSNGELTFWHRYNMENGNDGGVLEVSVNGGAWNDIETAGGVFVAGAYPGTLGGPQNPLAGRAGWTGNSGSFIQTRVTLPAGLLNQPVRFRWLMAQDRNGSAEGWYVDDVAVTTSSFETPGVPEIDLAVSDGSAAELGGTDTAQVEVVTLLPLLDPVGFSLTTGGTATAADVTGLGLSNLPAGQTSEAMVLTAVSDGQAEGPETLSFDLVPDAAFVIGGNGQAVVNIADTPYGNWAFTTLGGGPLSAPDIDKDGDGFDNAVEYVWGTDGNLRGSAPDPAVAESGGLLTIAAPLSSLPADVVIYAQQSADLATWDSVGMQTLVDAFGFPISGTEQFIRLAVEVTP